MSLLGLLDLGSSALGAAQAGVAVAGRNTANVGTEGYSREQLELSARRAAPLVGGVRTGSAQRIESALLSARERLAAGQQGSAGAAASAALGLEATLISQNQGLAPALANLFGRLTDLESAPLSPDLRSAAVAAADALAGSFHAAAREIAQAQGDADARIVSHATTATELALEIAAANRAYAQTADPVLADQRDLAARRLSALTGGQARIDPDGQMRFVIGGGTVLVDGERAASMRALPDASRGNHVRVEVVDGVHVADVTGTLGGTLGGELGFRDGLAAQAASDLDNLAFDFATAVNGVHRAHAGLDGVSGRDLLVAPASSAGAAAGFAVDPGVRADPARLAAAAVGAGSADNQGLAALRGLADQPLAGGGRRSFLDEALRGLGAIGAGARQARADSEIADARGSALAALRDDLSGVSLQEESTRLAQFQHASEAAVRFISTVDDLLANLINNL